VIGFCQPSSALLAVEWSGKPDVAAFDFSAKLAASESLQENTSRPPEHWRNIFLSVSFSLAHSRAKKRGCKRR